MPEAKQADDEAAYQQLIQDYQKARRGELVSDPDDTEQQEYISLVRQMNEPKSTDKGYLLTRLKLASANTLDAKTKQLYETASPEQRQILSHDLSIGITNTLTMGRLRDAADKLSVLSRFPQSLPGNPDLDVSEAYKNLLASVNIQSWDVTENTATIGNHFRDPDNVASTALEMQTFRESCRDLLVECIRRQDKNSLELAVKVFRINAYAELRYQVSHLKRMHENVYTSRDEYNGIARLAPDYKKGEIVFLQSDQEVYNRGEKLIDTTKTSAFFSELAKNK